MYDYRLFFEYLLEELLIDGRSSVSEFVPADLEKLRRVDIEGYLATFDISRRDKCQATNSDAGNLKARRLASLRSLYSYLCSNGDISANPAAVTPMPRINSKEVVSLSQDEVHALLHAIETGDGLPNERQKKLCAKTKLRDRAILILLLGTGVRISECVGLDLRDVDFDEASIRIIRKGGDFDEAYFPEEVEEALAEYIDLERDTLKPETDALFVSLSHGRLTDRSIENMVSKYVKAAGIRKHVKVHTTRATFATEVYRETNDVYMIKDALHHASLNTSQHYVSGSQERKRKAAKAAKTIFAD